MTPLQIALLFALTPLFNPAQGATASEEPAALASEGTRHIAWYGTWELGLAEAKRTGRPILLMSAAPRCHDVPGLW